MEEDFYIELVYKRLTHSINPEESAQLDKWIRQSDENQITAEAVKIAWEETGNLNASPKVDLDREFKVLEERIEFADAPLAKLMTPKTRRLKAYGWAIAAGIALLLLAGYLVQNSLFPRSVDWVEVNSGEQIEKIVMEEGSVISLNKNSTLEYPSHFSDHDRVIQLNGEAFFEVNKDPGRPFVIETQNEIVTVLGTSFLVRAYEDSSKASVLVATGKVQLEPKDKSSQLILEAGDQGSFNRDTHTLEKEKEVSLNSMAWHTHKFYFENTSMSEVIPQIEAAYGVDIEVENANLYNCLLTTRIDEADIQKVLEMISLVFGLEVDQKSENQFFLKGDDFECGS